MRSTTLISWSLLLAACPADTTPDDSGSSGIGSGGASSGSGEPHVTTDISDPETTTGSTGTTAELTAISSGTSTGETGDTSTSTGEMGDTSTGDKSTGEDSDTGGDGFEPFVCCEMNCTHSLVQGLGDDGLIEVDGDRMITIGFKSDGLKVILWDRLTGAAIRVDRGVTLYALEGGVLQLYQDDVMRWYDAADGAPLGSAPGSFHNGLAIDGSYAWVGTANGLTAYKTDGSELWTLAGNFASNPGQGLPDTLYAVKGMTGDLVAIDVGTGVATPVPKVGQVIGWFHDSGRFWTNDGPTTHIYEPDGAEIGVVVGGVMMGAYDHFLTAQSVRHVDMPGKNVKTVDVEFHARNGIKTKGRDRHASSVA